MSEQPQQQPQPPFPAVERRKCGSADPRSGSGEFEVPVLCIGSWSFGGSDKDYWGASDQKDVEALVRRSVEIGCTFFDTAEMYNAGNSERSLGAAVNAEQGLRAKVVIGSKILPQHCFPGKCREHLLKTLERLGTDHVELYMVHWPFKPNSFWGPDTQMPSPKEAFAELHQLQSEGKIKHLGVSNFGVKQIREILEIPGARPVINELPYSLFTRGIEHELLPLLREHSIGVLAYSPLMQGLLTDATAEAGSADALPAMRCRTRHFRSDRPASRHQGPGCEEELFRELKAIQQVAKRLNLKTSELAIAWVLANPSITSCIAGSRNVQQLEENARACSIRLAPEVVAELNRITEPVKAHLGPYLDIYSPISEQRTE